MLSDMLLKIIVLFPLILTFCSCTFLGFYCTINSLEQSLHYLLGTEFLSVLFDANHKHIRIASVYGQVTNGITHATSICLYTFIVIHTAKLSISGLTHSNSITSWLIVECGTLEGEKSPSKPDEQPTQEEQDMNNNEGIYEMMM